MAERANQHFVPQFLFRLFNGGSRFIHVLLRKSGDIRLHAPIKGQCAKRNFYGNEIIESTLSQIEARHAVTLRKLVQFAWDTGIANLRQDFARDALFAVLLQRSRTEHQVYKQAPMQEELAGQMFRGYLATAPSIANREELLDVFDAGKVRIIANPQFIALQGIALAFQLAPLLADLRIVLLRNRTEDPFFFR